MKVELYVYDISNGYAKMLSPVLLGKQVDVVPHTGVVLDGKTEFFLGEGICRGPAGDCLELEVSEIINLGETEKTEDELRTWLVSQMGVWTDEHYDFFDNNCNHFSNSVCTYLGSDPVPDRILHIAQYALSGRHGVMLRHAVKGMESVMKNARFTFNPFSNVESQ